MTNDMKLLQDRVSRQKNSLRTRQKKMYQLAKNLGFSAGEAVILQNWSEDRIRGLASQMPTDVKK